MAGYLVNASQIIATEMRDRARNERARCQDNYSFQTGGTISGSTSCSIVILQVVGQTEQGEPSQPASGAPSSLVADQRQTRTLVDQIVNWMPQLIERDVLAAKKDIKYEMQKELAVLKNIMDGLEAHLTTQSLENIWGELRKSKSGKRRHRAGESGEEILADLSREARRKERKAHKASKKDAQEKEALEQQQRYVVLPGASGSGVPISVSGSQPDPELVS
ncbi:hypothetical protein KY284_007889 [Solanum tuberosum]|nr:hypothetical protein KY284_007889 [Solanum tuberosum]